MGMIAPKTRHELTAAHNYHGTNWDYACFFNYSCPILELK